MKILNSIVETRSDGFRYLTIKTNIPGHQHIVFTILASNDIYLLALANRQTIFLNMTSTEGDFRRDFGKHQNYMPFLKGLQCLVNESEMLKKPTNRG